MHLAIWENVASVTGTMIIVQTNIHHRSKLFTTGQYGYMDMDMVNPWRYVIKCEGGR